MPRLTEYLLKLSTDLKELETYRKLRADQGGTAKLRAYLTRKPNPGLTEKQAKAVVGHDSHDVVQAIMEELKRESSRPGEEFYGIPVTFVSECNHVLQLTPNPHPHPGPKPGPKRRSK